MSKLTFDLSGVGGLVERHQGDLNDTSSKPHLRYLGGDGQLADGYFNPLRKYGYMAPANNSYLAVSGTIATAISSMVYDGESDILYAAEEENILKLDGLDDTSLANYASITSTYDIKDMVIYEVNGVKSLVYAIDTNTTYYESASSSTSNAGGMYLGFKTLDTTEGATVLEKGLNPIDFTSGVTGFKLVDAGSINLSALKARKLTQEFDGGDVYGRKISGVSLSLRRSAGTGSGITIKVSIQSPATASTGIYTSRGAWASGTAYVVNDTVTSSGSTFQCHTAHTSAAGNTPPSGGGAADYWNYFGSPDGTILASGTFSLSSVPVLADYAEKRFTVEFTTPVTGLGAGNYWIVVEEVGSVMTASDELSWLGTVNNAGIYDGYKAKLLNDTTVDYWKSVDANDPIASFGLDTLDFRLINNRSDNWTTYLGSSITLSTISGSFGVETGQRTFLHVSENGLLYWVVGNKVHTINGGITGSGTGIASENVLQFADYTTIPDIGETRGRMYIAVQTSNITTATDPRTFTGQNVGVFVWDKRSTVLGSTDYYRCPGAKEIKKVFVSSDGSVKAITVGNSGFTEIRGISGNQFAVLHTFEKDGYPNKRNGLSQFIDMSLWLGANGAFYGYGSVAPGEKEALYKLGNMASIVTGTLTSGALLVGNEYASAPQQAVLFSYADSTTYKMAKWYPNGEGTLNSFAQTAHSGDVYTLVKYLPELSKLNTITVYCAPTTSSAATTIATAKIYINQSSTAKFTKTITQAQASRGYIHWELNQPNVNSVQIEFEPSTSQTLGANDFMPSLAIVDYSPTTTRTPDGG